MSSQYMWDWLDGIPDGHKPLTPGHDCLFCKHLPNGFVDKINCAKYPDGIPKKICLDEQKCDFAEDELIPKD